MLNVRGAKRELANKPCATTLSFSKECGVVAIFMVKAGECIARL